MSIDFLERNVTNFYVYTDAVDNGEFIETTITIAVVLD